MDSKLRVLLFFFILSLSFFLFCCGESKEIQIVKNGYLNGHPERTIGDAVNNFFGSPKWESGVGIDGETKGKTLVNVKGKMMFMDKEVTAALQFIVEKENGTFRLNACELNGIPQNMIMYAALIEKMYQSQPKTASATKNIAAQNKPEIKSENTERALEDIKNEFLQSDKEINKIYKEVTARLSPASKAELKKEQLAWIKQKESNCYAESDDAKRLMCLTQMTNERILRLKNYPAN